MCEERELMKKNIPRVQHVLFPIFAMLVVSACKPSMVEIDVYTSDLRSGAGSEVVEVPIKANFRLLGDDKEKQLPKAKAIALKYMASDSEVEIVKGNFGKVMTVVSTIPLGTKSALDQFLEKNPRLAMVVLEGKKVKFLPTSVLEKLNKELRPINFMLSVDFPAKSTVFRITGDSKEKMNIFATAVFSQKKPYLQFVKDVKRRKSIEIEFKGGEDSIYNEIPPHFLTK